MLFISVRQFKNESYSTSYIMVSDGSEFHITVLDCSSYFSIWRNDLRGHAGLYRLSSLI